MASTCRVCAVGRLAAQLAGLGLVAYAADVFQVPFWYVYLAAADTSETPSAAP